MSTKGYGAKLQSAPTLTTTSGSWVALGKVKSIKPNKITAKDIDVTGLESPDEFDESIPGLASSGEMEATLYYDKTATAAVYGQFRTQQAFRLMYADNSGWKFPGFLSEIGDEEVVNGDVVMTSIKIKATGKPAFVADLTI